MTLSTNARQLHAALADEDNGCREAVLHATEAAVNTLVAGYITKPRRDDAHAELQAAVYRYVRACCTEADREAIFGSLAQAPAHPRLSTPPILPPVPAPAPAPHQPTLVCGVELTLDTHVRVLVGGQWIEGAVNESPEGTVALYSANPRGRRDAIHFHASTVLCLVIVGAHPQAD